MKKRIALFGGGLVVAIVVGVLVVFHRQANQPLGKLEPSPSVVFQGDQVRLNETGLLPAEPVEIRITENGEAGPTRSIRLAQANLSGQIDQLSVVLPEDISSGAHRLVVVGGFTGRTSVAVVYVRSPAPWITLQDGTLRPRQTFGLILGGFTPHENVLVSLQPEKATTPGTPVPAPAPAAMGSLPTDPAGNSVWTKLRIPTRVAGKYTIVARGSQSGLVVRKAVDLQAYVPLLDLSPWSGPPGVPVTLNVRGFEPGETIRVYVGTATSQAGQATADRNGDSWGKLKVRAPYGTLAGAVEVKLVGEDSGVMVTRSFTVQKPKPWLELSDYWGPPTAGINLSGGGWASDDQITIHLGSALGPAIGHARADDYGWLHPTAAVYVPLGATNQVVFVAVGAQSQASASATFKVVYPFGLGPTPVATPGAGQS